MCRKISLFLFFILFSVILFAQKKQTLIDLQDYRYKNEASGGLRIQSNGFSLFAEYGWIKDIYRTRVLQLEYNYYIDYRQKRQKAMIEEARGYTFGVQNKLHMIHLSYGIKRVLADKANRNGVRLSFVFFGGVSLALLKPYYLELAQHGDSTFYHKPERYSEANADRFLDNNYIYGAAPIRYGLNQIQPVVGLHSKSSLDFDWGSKDAFVKALQAGVMLDVYYKRLPIMINSSNRFYQLALFVSFQFGKRW